MEIKYHDMAEIGKRIKELREKAGLTQQQLADMDSLRVQRSLVGFWEIGKRDLNSNQIIALANIFNVSCDYILRGIEPENITISKDLGLSNKAIKRLKDDVKKEKEILSSENKDIIYDKSLFSHHFINTLLEEDEIENGNLIPSFVYISRYLNYADPLLKENCNYSHYKVVGINAKDNKEIPLNQDEIFDLGPDELAEVYLIKAQRALNNLRNQIIEKRYLSYRKKNNNQSSYSQDIK